MENPYQTPAADVIAAPATHTTWAFKDPTWLTWVCRPSLLAGALVSLLMIAVMARQYSLFEEAAVNGWTVDDVYAASLAHRNSTSPPAGRLVGTSFPSPTYGSPTRR